MTEEPNHLPEQSGDQSAQRLYDLGAALVESQRGSVYCLTIIGQVEGHSVAPNNTKTTKYEHVLPLLAHLEQSEEVDGVLLLLNQSYRYFERVQESIVSFVARHSRITEDAFRQLMLADGDMSNDVGTILYGSQAVQLGLIDRLGTLSDALEALYAMIGKNG